MYARKYLAELLGTFLFFAIGLASVQAVRVLGDGRAPLMVVVPLGFGFGLLAAIFTFGHISGGHFNPAVSVAMVVDRRMPPLEAAGYIISQIIGAVGAAALIYVLWDKAAVAATITQPGNGFDAIKALAFETILTAFFLLVILTATKHQTSLAALAIPVTLVAIHLAAVPFTGASVNPARSIGPALVGGDLTNLWIYLVGPTLGGIIGALIYRAANPASEVEAAG